MNETCWIFTDKICILRGQGKRFHCRNQRQEDDYESFSLMKISLYIYIYLHRRYSFTEVSTKLISVVKNKETNKLIYSQIRKKKNLTFTFFNLAFISTNYFVFLVLIMDGNKIY